MLIEGPEKKSSPYQNMVRHLHTTKEIHHEATERFPESTGWAVERTIESLKRRDYNSSVCSLSRVLLFKGKAT